MKITSVAARRPVTLDRSRTSMSALFCLTGALNALWGAALPATDARLELGTARLGGLLLVLGAGTLLAMPGAGWLAGRWTGRRLLLISAPACALALIGPASAAALRPLACFVFGFGLLMGVLNVALTVEAAALERRYARRPASGDISARIRGPC